MRFSLKALALSHSIVFVGLVASERVECARRVMRYRVLLAFN